MNPVKPTLNVQLFSDLHREFSDFTPVHADVDVVVLAGDIDLGTRGIAWAIDRFAGKPVVYVAGNHEFYGHNFPDLYAKLRAASLGSQVHVLQNSSVEISGWLFLGCTLWTDFALHGNSPMAMLTASGLMNDYARIRSSNHQYRKLRPADTLLHHTESVSWLEYALAASGDKPCVVVTHHAPSASSIPEEFRFWDSNPCYASRLDDLILRRQPVAWMHGHVHRTRDYVIGGTRVLCHPRGYDDGKHRREETGFDPFKLFTLSVNP